MLETDQTLTCAECGTQFPFSAAEQAFFAERGFTAPKRCKPCRTAAKARQGMGGGGGAPRSGGGDRPMYQATCAQCGVDTEVPFKPTGARPVLCRPCFQSNR